MDVTTWHSASGLSHDYLSPADVCQLLPGVTIQTLAMWRYRGKGPPYRKLGRIVVYFVDGLDQWIEDTGRGRTP